MEQMSGPLRRRAGSLPFLANGKSQRPGRPRGRTQLRDDLEEGRLQLFRLGIDGAQFFQHAFLQCQAGEVGLLIPGALARQQIPRGQKQLSQVAGPQGLGRGSIIAAHGLAFASAGTLV